MRDHRLASLRGHSKQLIEEYLDELEEISSDTEGPDEPLEREVFGVPLHDGWSPPRLRSRLESALRH